MYALLHIFVMQDIQECIGPPVQEHHNKVASTNLRKCAALGNQPKAGLGSTIPYCPANMSSRRHGFSILFQVCHVSGW